MREATAAAHDRAAARTTSLQQRPIDPIGALVASARSVFEGRRLSSLYRWGWAPLVAGCAVLTAAAVGGGELLVHALGRDVYDATTRWMLMARGGVTSLILAAWAGWYVLGMRKRLETERERLAAARREAEATAERARHAAGLGALSRIVAHEIRNPLNTIAIHHALLDRRLHDSALATDPAAVRALDAMRTETKRLERLVSEYIAFAGDMDVRPRATDLAALVCAMSTPVRVEVAAPEALPKAHVDPHRLTEALDKLLARASIELPGGAAVRVRLDTDGPYVRLRVSADGRRFEDPDAVFRPFSGDGDAAESLSYAFVREVARAHGGDVSAANDGPSGTPCITLRIPRS